LNAKPSEVNALLGRLRLADYDSVLAHRAALFNRYRDALPELQFQLRAPGTQAHQFVPALLPTGLGGRRAAIRAELSDQGIATGAYFSPHPDGAAVFPKSLRGRSNTGLRRCFRKDDESTSVRHHDSP
jgi:dTDP-4-amino-4,6-dideoxygalactose transaminase